MDEQEMDVVDHGEAVDRERAATLRRGRECMDAMRHRIMQAPARVLTGMIGTLPVQTREHLRQSAHEGLLAVQSFFEAVGSSGIQRVDRLFTATQRPSVPPAVDPPDVPSATPASPSPATPTARAPGSGT